jgi:drug/metabolite transporter (DMT)-like permease
LIIAAFAAVYIIWGSTYLAIKYAIETIPPFLMAGGRFLIAGSIIIGWCISKKESIPWGKSLGIVAISGVLMLFFGNAAVGWVEQYLPTGIAAIVVASLPLWFVALDKKQWQYNFSNKLIILGVLVGFGGVLLLVLDKKSLNIANDPEKLVAFFVLVAGTICWATGSLISKYKKVNGSTIAKAGIQMLAAGVVSIIAGFYQQRACWVSIGTGFFDFRRLPLFI